jgi:hypothetical protein
MDGMSKKLTSLTCPLWVGLAVLLMAGATSLRAEPRLGTNMPAPSLAGAHWIRGGPITNCATGQVYVVEFRAPTNAAARAAIPGVAALAQRYASRVSFVSVNLAVAGVSEEKRLADLAAFVRDQGPRLSYAVAADTADGSLAQAWLQAAGRTNLPVAFVVDRRGTITWIGHPSKGLDEALMRAGAGALPGVTAKAASPELALRQRVSELRRAGKPREALAALEEATAGNPILARSAVALRMSLLFQLEPASAAQEARQLADGPYRNDPPILSTVAGILLTSRESADKAFALSLAERACEQTGYSESSMVSVLARAQAGNGNPAKAIEVLEAFVKKLEASGGAGSPQMRSTQTELARYRNQGRSPGSQPESAPLKKLGDPE